MVSAFDIPASVLIKKVSEKLKKNEAIKPGAWAKHVKTGAHAERRPHEADWWYTRCASLLRKVYVEDNVGVGRLRTWYGGKQNRGSKPDRRTDASGSIIRRALQQLESAGYVKKAKAGRVLTSQGRSLLDKTVLEIKRETKREIKEKKEEKPGEKVERGRIEAREVSRAAEPIETTARVARTRKTKKDVAKKPARAVRKGKASKPKARKSRARRKG